MSENYKFKAKKGSITSRIRRGRGNASGKGGESGRGHKGQKSRSGYSYRAGFEGGRMPLYKRIPKKRGLGNRSLKEDIVSINLSFINNSFNDNDVVDIKSLSLIKMCKLTSKVKILGDGEITKKLIIKAHAFSKSAEQKINNSNATLELI